MSNTDKEKYIKDNFDLWKGKYKFADHLDFNVKSLFGLQYDFATTPSDHVKNKRELLDMILRIQSHLPHGIFEEKK